MPVGLIALGGALTGTASAGLALAAGTAAVGATAYTAAKAIGGSGSSSTPVAQRDPATEGTNMLAAQEKTAPQQFADYSTYAPQYDAVDLNRLRTLMGASGDSTIFDLNKQLTDQANLQTTTSNTALRQADINDVANLGGRAKDAARQANPELYGALNSLSTAANAGVPATTAETQYNQMAGQGYTPVTGTNVTANQVNAQQLGAGQSITNQNLNAVTLGQSGPQVTADRVNSPQASMLSRYQNMQSLFAGPTGVEGTLQNQAQQGLDLGTSLAPEEVRAAQQAARAAAQSRGLGMSNGALAGEVLNTYQAGQARMRERQAFAGQANQLYRAGQAQDQSFGLNVQNQNLSQQAQGLQAQQSNQAAGLQAQGMNQSDLLSRQSYDATNQQNTNNAMFQQNMAAQLANQQNTLTRDTTNAQLGMQGDLANQDAGLRAALANQQNSFNTQTANNALQSQQMSDLANSNAMQQARQAQAFAQQQAAAQGWLNTYQDPYMAILGRQSSNAGTNAGLMNIGNSITSPNSSSIQSMFNPYNSYSQDLNSSNQSAAYNLAIGNQNASSAKSSALIGAGGSILGAWLCWVAREVYGAFDPRWLMFRHWLLTEAPWWFRKLYLTYGERFACYISDKPYLKSVIRSWMNSRIQTLTLAPHAA